MNIREINEHFEFSMLVKADQRLTLPDEESLDYPISYHQIEEIHENITVFIHHKKTNTVYSLEVADDTDEVIRARILNTVEKILNDEDPIDLPF